MLEQVVELGPERRVGLGRAVVLLQVEDQRHQRLGDVAAAELAEVRAFDVREPPIVNRDLRPTIVMVPSLLEMEHKLMDAETAFGVHATLDPVVAGILGGAGKLMGGVLGELVLQPIVAQVNTAAGSVPGLASLVYGLILMLVILFIPKGILGVIARSRRSARRGGDSWSNTSGGRSIATSNEEEGAIVR
jgi:hypothetical protein